MPEYQPNADNSPEGLCTLEVEGPEARNVVFVLFALMVAYLIGILCGAALADPWGLFDQDGPWIGPPGPHVSQPVNLRNI